MQEFWLTKSPKHNRDESTIQNSKNLSRNGIIFTGRGNRRGCLIAIERYNVIRNSHHFCLENKSAWAVWISELHLISISKQVCNVDLLIRNLTWLSCSPLFRSRCVLNHPPSREMTCCKSNVTYRIVSRNFVISFRIVFWSSESKERVQLSHRSRLEMFKSHQTVYLVYYFFGHLLSPFDHFLLFQYKGELGYRE